MSLKQQNTTKARTTANTPSKPSMQYHGTNHHTASNIHHCNNTTHSKTIKIAKQPRTRTHKEKNTIYAF